MPTIDATPVLNRNHLVPTATTQPVWLKVGTLLDGLSAAPQRDVHFVYDQDMIHYIGLSDDPPPANLRRPNQLEPDAFLPGHTLLPGLIEAHAHMFLEGGEEDPAKRMEYLKLSGDELLDRAVERLRRLLAIGVIAVRDAGDKNGVSLALQQYYHSKGRSSMPYIDSPGAALHHQGRYGSFMGQTMEEHPSLEACVEARIRDGAYRIKLLATGIINFEKGAVTSKPQMPVEELLALKKAAYFRGRQTIAHASGNDGVGNCIAAGIDSIEHGFFIDDDQLAQMRDKDLAWVPTFAPVQFQVDKAASLGWSDTVKSNLQRILDGHAKSLLKANQLGVRIVAGSDAGSHGVPHGWGLLKELELMEQAGLGCLQIINAATGRNAERLGYAEDFGILRLGAKPRFILTQHSPLESLNNLRKAKTVVFDDEIFDQGDDAAQPGL